MYNFRLIIFLLSFTAQFLIFHNCLADDNWRFEGEWIGDFNTSINVGGAIDVGIGQGSCSFDFINGRLRCLDPSDQHTYTGSIGLKNNYIIWELDGNGHTYIGEVIEDWVASLAAEAGYALSNINIDVSSINFTNKIGGLPAMKLSKDGSNAKTGFIVKGIASGISTDKNGNQANISKKFVYKVAASLSHTNCDDLYLQYDVLNAFSKITNETASSYYAFANNDPINVLKTGISDLKTARAELLAAANDINTYEILIVALNATKLFTDLIDWTLKAEIALTNDPVSQLTSTSITILKQSINVFLTTDTYQQAIVALEEIIPQILVTDLRANRIAIVGLKGVYTTGKDINKLMNTPLNENNLKTQVPGIDKLINKLEIQLIKTEVKFKADLNNRIKQLKSKSASQLKLIDNQMMVRNCPSRPPSPLLIFPAPITPLIP